MFWWDGTKWNTPPKTPSTSSTQPVTYYVWNGPSQVLDNPDKTKPPVTVHDGDVYWWADGTWHTSKVPPVLPSGSTGGHKIPNTGDFVYYGPGGWDYGKPLFTGGTMSSRPPEFGSLPTIVLPSSASGPTGTGYQWSGDAPTNLTPGILLQKGDYFWWDGTKWNSQPLASGDPSLTTPPGVSGPISGQWHASDPKVEMGFNSTGGYWYLNMELPAGLHGDALEIKASVEGGYVGIPDQMTWFNAAGIAPAASLTAPNAGSRWATYTAGAAITATPTPGSVFDVDLTTKPLVVGDLLEWVHLRISANDPSPLAGGIEGFSYKVEGFPGGATSWTVKDGDTRAANDVPAVKDQYVHWVGGQVNQWVLEGATAANPVGYWEDASAGTMGQLWTGTAATGSWPFTPAVVGAVIPQAATDSRMPVSPSNPVVPPSKSTVPVGAPAGSVVFTADKLPDPNLFKNAQGELTPFVIVVSVSNEDIDNGYPDDYLLLFEFEPPNPIGEYPLGSIGQFVKGTDVGLATGSGNLYLPDGWLYIGKLKGIPGPAGQIRHATSRTLNPIPTPVTTGTTGPVVNRYELADATVVLSGHPSYRDIDFGIPAGLPANITEVKRIEIASNMPPRAEIAQVQVPPGASGAVPDPNEFILTMWVPRGLEMTPGEVAGPGPGVGITTQIFVQPPNGPGNVITSFPLHSTASNPPTKPAKGDTYLITQGNPGDPPVAWITATGANPGDWITYDGTNWIVVPKPKPETVIAGPSTSQTIYVDTTTGTLWQSKPVTGIQIQPAGTALPQNPLLGEAWLVTDEPNAGSGPFDPAHPKHPPGTILIWDGLKWVGGVQEAPTDLNTLKPVQGDTYYISGPGPYNGLPAGMNPAEGDHITYQFIVNPTTGQPEGQWVLVPTSTGAGQTQAALDKMEPQVWTSSGSIKGSAGTLKLGTISVHDDLLLPPLPIDVTHAKIVNSGEPSDAILDITMPRATRWWYGPVPPTPPVIVAKLGGAATPLPANPAVGDVYELEAPIPNVVTTEFTVAGQPVPVFNAGDMIMWNGTRWMQRPPFSLPTIGGTQMEPHAWDYYVDALTGDVFFYIPGTSTGLETTLDGLATKLPANPIVGVRYQVGTRVPTSVTTAVAPAAVKTGDYIAIDTAGKWSVVGAPTTTPGSWSPFPVANLRGPQGPPGPGIRFRGLWDPSVTKVKGSGALEDNLADGGSTDTSPGQPYHPGDIVMFNGIAYMVTQTGPTTNPDGSAVP